MARMPRDQELGIFHVWTHGVDRRNIFGLGLDHDLLEARHLFGRVLRRAVRDNAVSCHAYCQMGTHYHLVLEVLEPGALAPTMEYLNGVYARELNAMIGRRGHLFERRYHSRRVEGEGYLVHTLRYVVLNPVRARMFALPGAWPWSNYRATAGLVSPPPYLDTRWTLGLFDENIARARVKYAAFVAAGIGDARAARLSATDTAGAWHRTWLEKAAA